MQYAPAPDTPRASARQTKKTMQARSTTMRAHQLTAEAIIRAPGLGYTLQSDRVRSGRREPRLEIASSCAPTPRRPPPQQPSPRGAGLRADARLLACPRLRRHGARRWSAVSSRRGDRRHAQAECRPLWSATRAASRTSPRLTRRAAARAASFLHAARRGVGARAGARLRPRGDLGGGAAVDRLLRDWPHRVRGRGAARGGAAAARVDDVGFAAAAAASALDEQPPEDVGDCRANPRCCCTSSRRCSSRSRARSGGRTSSGTAT